MIEFIDKTSQQSGTPLNRLNMMAIQGFEPKTTVFNNGIITQTNLKNEILTINPWKLSNGRPTQIITIVGQKTLKLIRTMDKNGNVTETIE